MPGVGLLVAMGGAIAISPFEDAWNNSNVGTRCLLKSSFSSLVPPADATPFVRATPACRSPSCARLRPLSGRSRIPRVVTTYRSAFVAVPTSVASASAVLFLLRGRAGAAAATPQLNTQFRIQPPRYRVFEKHDLFLWRLLTVAYPSMNDLVFDSMTRRFLSIGNSEDEPT